MTDFSSQEGMGIKEAGGGTKQVFTFHLVTHLTEALSLKSQPGFEAKG